MLVSSKSFKKKSGIWRVSRCTATGSAGVGPMRRGSRPLKEERAATVRTASPLSARTATPAHPPDRRVEREIAFPQRIQLALCLQDQLAYVAHCAATAGLRGLPVHVLLDQRMGVRHRDGEPDQAHHRQD